MFCLKTTGWTNILKSLPYIIRTFSSVGRASDSDPHVPHDAENSAFTWPQDAGIRRVNYWQLKLRKAAILIFNHATKSSGYNGSIAHERAVVKVCASTAGIPLYISPLRHDVKNARAKTKIDKAVSRVHVRKLPIHLLTLQDKSAGFLGARESSQLPHETGKKASSRTAR